MAPLLSFPIVSLHPKDQVLAAPLVLGAEVRLEGEECGEVSVVCGGEECGEGGRMGVRTGGQAWWLGRLSVICRNWGKNCGERGKCGGEGEGVVCREQEDVLETCYRQSFPFWEGVGDPGQEGLCCTHNLTTVLPR